MIQDNQPAKAGNRHLVGKLLERFIDRAIGQWHRLLECIAQQQGEQIEHLM